MRKIFLFTIVGLSTIFAPRTRELQDQPEIGTDPKHVYHFPGQCNPGPRPDKYDCVEQICDLVTNGTLELRLIKLHNDNVKLSVTKMCKTDNPFEQQTVDIVFNRVSRTSPELIAQIAEHGSYLTTREQIMEFFLEHMSHAQVGEVFTKHVFGYQEGMPYEKQNPRIMDLEFEGFIDSYAMMAIILDAQPYFTLRNMHPLACMMRL